MKYSLRVALVAALACVGVACRSAAQREFEAEVGRLSQAIDSLRNAPNEAKTPLIAALEGVPCSDARATALKQVCVDAYKLLDGARQAGVRAKELLAQKDGGPAAALAAASEVTRAEADLLRAKDFTERCASEQGRLIRDSRAR